MYNSSWGRQQLASLKSLSQIGALRRATFRSKKRYGKGKGCSFEGGGGGGGGEPFLVISGRYIHDYRRMQYPWAPSKTATGKRKIHGSHEGIEYRRCIGTRCISASSHPLIPPGWRGGESERRRLILSPLLPPSPVTRKRFSLPAEYRGVRI